MRSPGRTGLTWLWVLGVALVVSGLPLSRAQGGETKAEQPAAAPGEKKAETPAATPAAPAEKSAVTRVPAGLVGTIVSVEPNTRTLVMDVPRGKGVFTVGAWATDQTRITAGGKKVSFESLKQGARVRITFHRVPTGDVLTSVTVLRGSKG